MGIVSKRVRKQVYKKCDGRCAYCGNPVEFAQMQVDHLVPALWNFDDEMCARLNVVRGTDHIENLMPSCRRCNKWKAAFSIDQFREEIFAQHERLLRDKPGYKLGIDYGFIKVVTWDGKFYFEKMNNFSASYQRVKA